MTGDVRQETQDLSVDLDPMQHLRNLDYSRRAGTEGERKAAAYIAGVLAENGIESARQEFHFERPKLLPKLVPPLVLLLWTILSLANLRYWDSNPIMSLLVLALPSALILAVLNLDRVMRVSFARRRKKLRQVAAEVEDGTLPLDQVVTSQNVIAELGPEDAEKQVLFTAHFDSVSSMMPMRVTTICMGLGFAGTLLYSLAILANFITRSLFGLDFLQPNFSLVAAVALITLCCLEVFFLSRLFRGNESHGIIDDGTGVAILLELARFVREHPIPGYKITFGFFGAEEAGLVGSATYYDSRPVDKSRLHVISVDMIGEKPPLSYVKGIYPVRRRQMDAAFNAQIASIAEQLDIEVKGKNFPYPGSDFGHFMLDGECRTNWFISQSDLIHSKRDTLDNVQEALVQDALKLLVAYLTEVGGPGKSRKDNVP